MIEVVTSPAHLAGAAAQHAATVPGDAVRDSLTTLTLDRAHPLGGHISVGADYVTTAWMLPDSLAVFREALGPCPETPDVTAALEKATGLSTRPDQE